MKPSVNGWLFSYYPECALVYKAVTQYAEINAH